MQYKYKVIETHNRILSDYDALCVEADWDRYDSNHTIYSYSLDLTDNTTMWLMFDYLDKSLTVNFVDKNTNERFSFLNGLGNEVSYMRYNENDIYDIKHLINDIYMMRKEQTCN